MAESKRKTKRRVGGVVVVILLFAAVAFVGLLFALYLGSARSSSNEQAQQIALMCLVVAMAALALLLAGPAWTGSSVVARAVVGGLLSSLSMTIIAALALAAFDYCVTHD